MEEDRLRAAMALMDEIKSIESFIFNLEKKHPSVERHIVSNAIINIRTIKTFSIFSSRCYQMGGVNVKSIDVPDSLILEIVDSSKKRLKELKEKYDMIWSNRVEIPPKL